jgi:hypothetical protein
VYIISAFVKFSDEPLFELPHTPRERERVQCLETSVAALDCSKQIHNFNRNTRDRSRDRDTQTKTKKRPPQNDNKSTNRCLESRFCAPNETLEWDKPKLRTNKITPEHTHHQWWWYSWMMSSYKSHEDVQWHKEPCEDLHFDIE